MNSFKYTFLVLALIFTVFTYDYSIKVNEVISGEKTCLCAYDGFGYYMYLPYYLSFENAPLIEWAKDLQGEYCEGTSIYQFVPTSKEKYANIYHIGLALLYLPSYIVGEIGAYLFNYPKDGFSLPYFIAHILNALLFIFIGAIYLRKLLLLFFNEKVSAIVLFLIYGSTNLFITFSRQYDLPHLFLFTLNAIFLYYLFRDGRDLTNKKNMRTAAIILGLTIAIRPTQALFGLIPLIILYSNYRFTKELWIRMRVFLVWGLIWSIPHIIYSIAVAGKFFLLNLHTEDLILSDPHLWDFLFSFKKGWLIYSPVFLLLPFSFYALYKNDRLLFKAFLIFVILYIYVMSSWENWWYATSFGSRVMVDIYPLLALVLGFLFLSLRNPIYRAILALSLLLSTGLSIFQSYQYRKGYIHYERMTQMHYFYVFGKTNIPNYHRNYLEMDRRDENWIPKMQALNIPEYEFKEAELLKIDQSIISNKEESIEIAQIKLYDHIPSDETLIQVSIRSRTSNPELSCKVWFQLVSKYNTYSWNSIEISEGSTRDKIIEYTLDFNLNYIRHRDDVLRIKLAKFEMGVVQIEEINIKAISLLRNAK